MLYIVIAVLVVLLVLAVAKIGSMSQPVNEMPSYEADPIEVIKVDWFNMNFKLVHVEEEDGTEQLEIRDKKTHATLGFVGEDLIVHSVKQQQEKKS